MTAQHLPISQESFDVAAGVIQSGGIVAYPTETSYGLAVYPFTDDALTRLFKAKQRSTKKALPVLVNSDSQLSVLVEYIPDIYVPLIKAFWPGPLTLIFDGLDNLPVLLTGGSGRVAARISSHPVAQQFVEAVAMPITATSANISGREPAFTATGVSEQLGDLVDCILVQDEGVAGNCSTIIGIEKGKVTLLRAGVLSMDEILHSVVDIVNTKS